MDPWDTVNWLARRQHQLVTTWQIRLAGLSDTAISSRIDHHRWRRDAPNVLTLPGEMTPLRKLTAAVLSLSPTHDVDRRVEALVERGSTRNEALASAAVDAGNVVCGRSALWLRGIGSAPAKPWVRVPSKSAGTSTGRGSVLRYGTYDGSVSWIRGLPTVSVEQGFLDIPGAKEHRSDLWLHHDLAALIATADSLRLTTVAKVRAALTAAPRFVGVRVLRRVLDDLSGELSHSRPEAAARRIVRDILAEFGLELHPRPYAIEQGGTIVGEADLAVLAILLDLEVDGPHHLLAAQQERDRRRDRAVRRTGWAVERFPTSLVDLSPQRFAAEVRECIQARVNQFAPHQFASHQLAPTRDSAPGSGISRRKN